jgi:hypothetical protein
LTSAISVIWWPGLIVRRRRLEQVAEIVELVAVVALVDPALLARPPVRALGVDRPRRVDVAVGLLSRGDLRDEAVDVGVQLGIGLHVQHVRRAFDDLVEVAVIERVGRRGHVVRLAPQGLRRALEIVHATRLVALLEGRRNRDRAVGLDPRRPEDVVQPDRGEGHRLDGIVGLILGQHRHRCEMRLRGDVDEERDRECQ